MTASGPVHVRVPAVRVPRWVENFTGRHGSTAFTVDDGALVGRAADGSWFRACLPFGQQYRGPAAVADFLADVREPADWGIVLVRKGGFAVGRLTDAELAASKVGRRHVQGRTKAGGQSQQRFARRRANQADAAYAAAADWTATVIGRAPVVVVGGDRQALAALIEDPRLRDLEARTVDSLPGITEPRRAELESAIAEARSVKIVVENATA